MRLVLIAFMLAAGAGSACAEGNERRAAAVTDALPDRPGVTYRMLLEQFMPGLTVDEAGGWAAPAISNVRTVDGTKMDDMAFAFRSVETLTMQSDGKPVLVVATDGDAGEGEFSIMLAAFDMTVPVPRLIDYVDAGMDRWTDLGVALPLAGDTDAFSVRGNHSNSSESFETIQIAFLHDGRIAPVAAVQAYGVRTCAWMVTQEASFEAKPEPGARYNPVTVSVTQETTRQSEDCGDDAGTAWPAPGKVTASDIYRWDEKLNAFRTSTDNRGKLVGPE